jgi:hypothetical protein
VVKETVADQDILHLAEDVFSFDRGRQPADDGQSRPVSTPNALPAAIERKKSVVVQPLLPKPAVSSKREPETSTAFARVDPAIGADVRAAISPSSEIALPPSTSKNPVLVTPTPANANHIVPSQTTKADLQDLRSLLPNSPASAVGHKELKSPSELAAMIEHDLALFPGCPGSGLRVTVYGMAPWRAMLTIGPQAGGVREPQKWRDLTKEFADQLRAQYDLAWE